MKKLLLIAFTLLVLPVPTFAMSQPLFGSITMNSGISGSTKYYPCNGGITSPQSNDQSAATAVSVAGVIKNLRVTTSVAPGAGTSITFTLLKAGSATALTCTVSDTNTTCTDSAHPITFAAGETCAWLSQATVGTPAATTNTLGATFTGTTDGEALIMGAEVANPSASVANYFPIFGGATATTTIAGASTTMPTSGTVDKMYITMSGAPGTAASGKAFDVTLYKNGVATGITCQVLNTATTCNDLTHSVSFAAGDSIAMESVPTLTPTARLIKWGFRFTPTINGESPLFVRDTAAVTATRYTSVYGAATNVGTESSIQAQAPLAFTLKKLYHAHGYYGTPSGAQTRTIMTRKNSADTLLTATTDSSNVFVSDLTNTVDFAVDDFLNFKSTTANTPPTNALMYYSAVAYVDPNVAAAVSSGFYRIYNMGMMLLRSGKLILN